MTGRSDNRHSVEHQTDDYMSVEASQEGRPTLAPKDPDQLHHQQAPIEIVEQQRTPS